MEINVEVLQKIKIRMNTMTQESQILVYIEKNKELEFREIRVYCSSLPQKT